MSGIIYSLIFLPMTGAVFSWLIGRYQKKGRDYFVSGVTVLEFILALVLTGMAFHYAGDVSGAGASLPGVCGMGLHFTADGFRLVYVCIAAFMWMSTALFSMEYFAHYKNRNRYYLFQLLTLGATVAIFLSADLYTTFVFFEIMSFASYVWVVQDERAKSLRAGATYLAVAVIGGLVMLMGLFLLYHQVGTLEISKLQEACRGKNVYAAAICMLVGFGAKAGAFPLHIWLPKAHPVAPAPASALLSGILTKTGIFGVLVISCKMLLHDAVWGSFILMLGVLTMVIGAVLALFSIDFKRTLACSSVSQIGFILVGIGMQGLLGEENALAVRGSFLHMVNHSLFKLVLFMVAGVIYMNLHKLDLNEIRGFGRKKPLLAFVYLMGAFGIGGIPLWSGYISKTLLHESIVEYTELLRQEPGRMLFFSAGSMKLIEWAFLISGGLTVAYMTKLFIAVFIEKNTDARLQEKYDGKKTYMNPVSSAVLVIGSLLFPVMGLLPDFTMDRLADMGQSFMGISLTGHQIRYFSLVNLKGGLTSVFIGALIYLLAVRLWMMKKRSDGSSIYLDRWPKLLDLEELIYRPVLLKVFPVVCGFICSVLDKMTDVLAKFLIIVGKTAAGLFDVSLDSLVVVLRKTVYRDEPRVRELEEGNELTHVLGRFCNGIEEILNHTIWKKNPKKVDCEHKMTLGYSEIKENMSAIGRSLSYGLILFCLGLCATLIYLLVTSVG